jgi:predicted DCC family thiol-disulfide oxidoreductase YuxK
MKNLNIIYFDDECLYCNRFVLFVLDHDKKKYFRFASVSKSLSIELLGKFHDSIILKESDKVHIKSDAVLFILKRLGGVWKLLANLVSIFPRFSRDFIYDLIARYRKSFIIKAISCRLLSEEEKSRFLKE